MLSLPLLTVELTADLVREAMISVRVEDVRNGVAETIGRSTLSKVSAGSAVVNESEQGSAADTDSG